jgi:hypothetical protein
MAANGKGEVTFQVGKKQFTWVFSTNAICMLEEHLDLGLVAITEELQSWLPPATMVDGKPVAVEESPEQIKARNGRVRLGLARSVFWAGLQDHHPGHSLKMAGDLIGEMGGLIPAMGVIMQGLGAAFPDAEPEGAAAHPRKASRKKK